jgi:hypothetical protein
VVRIHGNWCGPNWTGGQRVAADEYTGPWDGPAISKLDEACRRHDFQCSAGSCSRAADTELIVAARKRILNPADAMWMQVQLANPFMDPKKRKEMNSRLTESQDAELVVTGMEIARLFRRE